MTESQIEKVAREYADTAFSKFLDMYSREPWTEVKEFIENVYKDGAHKALSNQWREFGPDNSPCIGEEVLIHGETGDVMLAQIIEQRVGNGLGAVLKWHPEVKCKVTHWMPIPRPTTD